MRRLSASALGRAELCIGSVTQEGVEESGAYAATGQAVDDFVRLAKTGDKGAALAAAPEELRPYLSAVTLDQVPDGAEYQVAFAFNVQTGKVRRIPGRAQGYPADLGPEWIVGTTDIVGQRGGRAVVLDLKWGSYTDGRDPADDLQLGFYGVCAAAFCGVDEAEVGFLRAGWDGVLRPEVAILDEIALDRLRDRIATIWAAWRAELVHLRAGSHCTYCPALRLCPAQTTLVRAFSAEAVDAERVVALSPDEAGALWERACAVEALAESAKATLRALVEQLPEGIPLPDGRTLKKVKWSAPAKAPEAREREAALKEELKREGLIASVPSFQIRPVGKARKDAA